MHFRFSREECGGDPLVKGIMLTPAASCRVNSECGGRGLFGEATAGPLLFKTMAVGAAMAPSGAAGRGNDGGSVCGSIIVSAAEFLQCTSRSEGSVAIEVGTDAEASSDGVEEGEKFRWCGWHTLWKITAGPAPDSSSTSSDSLTPPSIPGAHATPACNVHRRGVNLVDIGM